MRPCVEATAGDATTTANRDRVLGLLATLNRNLSAVLREEGRRCVSDFTLLLLDPMLFTLGLIRRDPELQGCPTKMDPTLGERRDLGAHDLTRIYAASCDDAKTSWRAAACRHSLTRR